MPNKTKILLIRFSSFGDVTQCLSIPTVLKKQFPNAEIHWITKLEFKGLIETHPMVNRVWALNKKGGLSELLKILLSLRNENFSRVYDAHNNLRSHLIVWALNRIFSSQKSPQILRRSIRRWKRFLLFNFRINLFQQPFSGQRDLLEPLAAWGIAMQLPPPPQIFFKSEVQNKVRKQLQMQNFNPGEFICLAASAAHELKKWPKEYWQNLIREWPQKFVLLGGPADLFLAEIAAVAPARCLNLAGKLSFEESGAVIEASKLLITNDTGLLHVAEQLGHKAVALMGPAPFGFPSRYETTCILERKLPCKPCSKHGQGPCRNQEFHQCMRSISVAEVQAAAEKLLESKL